MILPFAAAWTDADAIPSDWQPGTLAPRAAVIAAVTTVFPRATEDDEGCFSLAEDWTEIRIGTEDPTESVNVTLRSGADPATIGRVVSLAALLDTRALDIQAGEFLTIDGGAASYAEWEDFLARALNSQPSEEPPGDIGGH
jgi:hypothetical protein